MYDSVSWPRRMTGCAFRFQMNNLTRKSRTIYESDKIFKNPNIEKEREREKNERKRKKKKESNEKMAMSGRVMYWINRT